jgi:LysR family transcriptional regulator, transcriptional activator of nhaA
MSLQFNYRHLYYFWVVGHEGGMSRAAERLGMAVQTVSAQVHELEHALGCALLKPAGRGLALTEAGQEAMRQADQIFQMGEALPGLVREAATAPVVRLAVGIADGIPKPIVQRLLEPIMQEPHLRLLCHDGEFEDLLAELALHRVDMVISDRPPPPNPSLRLYSWALGSSPIAWWATPTLAARIQQLRASAGSLAEALAHRDVGVLLPTGHNIMRERIDRWFDRHHVRPRIAGEFEDSALLTTFGASGLGVFPVVDLVRHDLAALGQLCCVGPCDGVDEYFYAITPQKKVEHRLVQRLTQAPAGTATHPSVR